MYTGNIISEILCSHGRSPRLDFHAENELQGTFPQWLAEMEVAYIILPDNRLIGSLPPALFHSHSLWLLALSKNNFSGELPKNIGDANFLRILMLAGNNFSGPIPPSTSQIPNLQVLDLSRNRFSGNTFPVFDPQGLLISLPTTLRRGSNRVFSIH